MLGRDDGGGGGGWFEDVNFSVTQVLNGPVASTLTRVGMSKNIHTYSAFCGARFLHYAHLGIIQGIPLISM